MIKYKVLKTFTILDKLFLIDNTLYISESIYIMDGRTDCAHKVFNANGDYLGMINQDTFSKLSRCLSDTKEA